MENHIQKMAMEWKLACTGLYLNDIGVYDDAKGPSNGESSAKEHRHKMEIGPLAGSF